MTRIEAFCRNLLGSADPDPAFAREYLERGGHYQTFHGDPERQDQWRRELPVRFVAYAQLTREERAS